MHRAYRSLSWKSENAPHSLSNIWVFSLKNSRKSTEFHSFFQRGYFHFSPEANKNFARDPLIGHSCSHFRGGRGGDTIKRIFFVATGV